MHFFAILGAYVALILARVSVGLVVGLWYLVPEIRAAWRRGRERGRRGRGY